MKYLAAYALVSLSGKKDITAADIKNVLGSTGANVSDADLNRLIESLKGKDINKLIASGASKLGGSAPVPVAAGKGASKPAEQKKKQQPKKQVKKKEQPKQQEEDFGLGGGLFD